VKAVLVRQSLLLLMTATAGCRVQAPAASELGGATEGAVAGDGGAEVSWLPGAPPAPAGLPERLRAALAARQSAGATYVPRTRHLVGKAPRYTNRLILETSPYLLQHAHNPVDWHAWGDEAFAEARRRGVPLFVSIGYSTCHWCHVMEVESFEDKEIARFMNGHYVCIKVDREERPDVDAVYMSAVQALTGSGGWPMSVWLRPDRAPFFGGTYFPPRDGDRGASQGFLTLLQRLSATYQKDPARIAQEAAVLASAVRRDLEGQVVAATTTSAPAASVRTTTPPRPAWRG